jgi:hypothetical protein
MKSMDAVVARFRKLCLAFPETFETGSFGHPNRGLWVSLWADERLSWRFIEQLAEQAYRTVATKRMIAALDSERVGSGSPPHRSQGRRQHGEKT